jgi:hypothetical protein
MEGKTPYNDGKLLRALTTHFLFERKEKNPGNDRLQ